MSDHHVTSQRTYYGYPEKEGDRIMIRINHPPIRNNKGCDHSRLHAIAERTFRRLFYGDRETGTPARFRRQDYGTSDDFGPDMVTYKTESLYDGEYDRRSDAISRGARYAYSVLAKHASDDDEKQRLMDEVRTALSLIYDKQKPSSSMRSLFATHGITNPAHLDMYAEHPVALMEQQGRDLSSHIVEEITIKSWD